MFHEYRTLGAELGLWRNGERPKGIPAPSDTARIFAAKCSSTWSPRLPGRPRTETTRVLRDVLEKHFLRGTSPFCDFEIEELLVERFGHAVGLSIEIPEGKKPRVKYELERDGWEELSGFRAFAANCDGLVEEVPLDPENPDNERRLLEQMVEVWGPGCLGYLETQADLPSFLGMDASDGFGSQRADFVLTLPNGRGLVIEPGDHGAAEEPRDRARDEAFRKQRGFQTIRPRNNEIGTAKLSQELRDHAERLGAIEYFEAGKPLDGVAELVLGPGYVARVQYAVLRHLLSLDLSTEEPVTIGVLDHDLQLGALGVWAAIRWLERWAVATGDPGIVPRIELHLVPQDQRDLQGGEAVPAFAGEEQIEWKDSADPRIPPHHEFLTIHVGGDLAAWESLDLVVDGSATHPGWWPTRARGKQTVVLRSAGLHEVQAWDAPRTIPIPLLQEVQDPEALQRALTGWVRDFFRMGNPTAEQCRILSPLFGGTSVIGLLPTGAGKSMCYQLASLLTPGTTLVVSPLVALINDQVQSLREEFGIDRTFGWHGQNWVDTKEAHRVLADNAIVFMTPERFLRPEFRSAVQAIKGNDIVINNAVIDEAHCLSMWGHDFRPPYLQLRNNIRRLCTFRNHSPRMLALTGTASQLVLLDLKRELGIMDPEQVVKPDTFDRPELEFRIEKVGIGRKEDRLKEILNEIPTEDREHPLWSKSDSGIVFTYTRPEVWGLFSKWNGGSVDERAQMQALEERAARVGAVTGSRPKGFHGSDADWTEWKQATMQAFKRGELSALAGNSAIGVGIDCRKVTWVVNYRMPQSLEAFYQQMGRAGRDGQESICYQVVTDTAPEKTQAWLDSKAGSQSAVKRPDRDDVNTIQWFFETSYPGPELEARCTQWVLGKLTPCLRGSTDTAQFRGRDLQREVRVGKQEPSESAAEKAIGRLMILGLIEDYTVRGYGEFSVQPVADACVRQHESPDSYKARMTSKVTDQLRDYIARYRPCDPREAARRLEQTGATTPSARAIAALVTFEYEQIDYTQKEALRTAVAFCNAEDLDPKAIRQRLIAYFDGSPKFSAALAEERLVEAESTALEELLDQVESYHDAEQLFWEARRLLDERWTPGWATAALFADLYRRGEPDASTSAAPLRTFMAQLDDRGEIPVDRVITLLEFVMERLMAISPELSGPDLLHTLVLQGLGHDAQLLTDLAQSQAWSDAYQEACSLALAIQTSRRIEDVIHIAVPH